MPEIAARYMKMSDAMRYASVSRKVLVRMLHDGDISGRKTPGGHWRIDRESIDAYFGNIEQKAIDLVRSLGL